MIIALLGAVIGTFTAIIYTKTIIFAISTIWKDIVSGSEILFYTRLLTLIIGGLLAILFSLLAVWITLHRSLKRPARELLAGALKWQYFKAKKVSKGRIALLIAALSALGAVVITILIGSGDSKEVSGAFFGAGSLLLISGLSLSYYLLKYISARWNNAVSSLMGLGLRNSTRRSGRSLAVIGLLACGIFLVISVGAFKQSPSQTQNRASGTGGFAL